MGSELFPSGRETVLPAGVTPHPLDDAHVDAPVRPPTAPGDERVSRPERFRNGRCIRATAQAGLACAQNATFADSRMVVPLSRWMDGWHAPCLRNHAGPEEWERAKEMRMSVVRVVLAVVLAGFVALSLRMLTEQSYGEFVETATANAATGLLLLDLIICLSLASVWMVQDARRHRIAAWPYIFLTAAFGAAGPLLYLIRRPRQSEPPTANAGPVPKAFLITALALFTAATIYALDRHGYVAVLLYASANPASQLLFVDLAICLSLAAAWMIADARSRGASVVPFLPLVLLFGSVGPLLYLVTRDVGRRGQRLVGLASLGLGGFALGLGTGHADLRTETVRYPAPDSERRGRELLDGLAERHGLTAWKRHVTMEVLGRDSWPGGGPWWPDATQRFRTQALLGTFTSRAELLDGPARDEVWGIQAWAPYKKKAGGTVPTFLSQTDRAITFYLPTLQYFNELPFRLRSAPVVRDAGDSRHRGRRYQRVLVTWGTPEPRPDHDQYVLWIDRETGLLSMVRYTLRDGLAWMPPGQARLFRSVMLGTMHYEDYRDVDGVMVPFVQTVVLPPPELTRYPLREHYFHRIEVEEAHFDTVPREALLPDPPRGEPGDRKPEPSATTD